MGPGTPRNAEESHGTPLTQSYVFTTQVMNEWSMSAIEDISATPRVPSSVRAWMESSKYGEYVKSRNMINIPLPREKLHLFPISLLLLGILFLSGIVQTPLSFMLLISFLMATLQLSLSLSTE